MYTSKFPRGVHFVGSVPLASTHQDPFHSQLDLAKSHQAPSRWRIRHSNTTISGAPFEEKALTEVIEYLDRLDTGYDTAAIESYSIFRKLRDDGVIPLGVEFQVCLPAPINMLCSSIAFAYRKLVEPPYTAALVRAMTTIQELIPHADLAIQIDCARDFGILEGMWKSNDDNTHPFTPHWLANPAGAGPQDAFEGVIDRIVAYAGQGHIAEDVDLGFHFCYGDLNHKHFLEPTDTRTMVNAAQAIISRLAEQGRPVQWIHMPVPKEHDDEAYFAPLRGLVPLLQAQHTELYLGLVREGDEEGTRRRIATAKKVLGEDGGVEWGVATECGTGRTAKEMVGSVLEIMERVSAPVR